MTGGEERVTLKINEIPPHSHKYYKFRYYATAQGGSLPGYDRYYPYTLDSNFDDTVSTTGTGGGCSHNNMPPFLTANCWQRTG